MHYHIVGIAGAGMSAIANILLDQGHRVSGSDPATNQAVHALIRRGVRVYPAHTPAHVAGADALLATAAVRADHPELQAARAAGIPLLSRADLWEDWSRQRRVIAVAGTHGKTTTTAMIALVLTRAGLHPGFLIGSDAPDLGTNARWGHPDAPLVIEADEYARAFLALRPHIAVVTNVEWDHPDVYLTEADYVDTFELFVGQVQQTLLVCGDAGMGLHRLSFQNCQAHVLSYGLEAANHYRAVPADHRWSVVRDSPAPLDEQLELTIPGLHNVRNALAAVAVADLLGIGIAMAADALRSFHGTARRFEFKGEAAGVRVVDDYAHHPTEVRATLAAARSWYGTRRIVAYLQPHTYSRTLALLEQWPEVFGDADYVLVGSIFGARETQSACEPGDDLAEELARRIAAVARVHGRPAQVRYVGSVAAASAAIQALVQPGDLLLTLGAGDGYRVGEDVLAYLRSR